ncbi:MAG: hypothetical protein ACRCTQ_04835, partial [Brevinemataceae bacterium]
MKFLLLLFLLLNVSATENNKQSVASYDIGQELILIDTIIDTNSLLNKECQYYKSLYQDTNTKKLYIASIKITNNISYTINSNFIIEHRFNPQQQDYLNYVGSLDYFKRIYTFNQQLYIKTLIPFKDTIYIETSFDFNKDPYTIYHTNKLILPVSPYIMLNDGKSFGVTYYTNKEGVVFTRKWNLYKQEEEYQKIVQRYKKNYLKKDMILNAQEHDKDKKEVLTSDFVLRLL